jgi:large subunit ribosomal protein L25
VADFSLEAETRTLTGKKVKQLRNQGLVPAIIYGPSHTPLAVQIPYRPLEVALMNAGGTNLVDITVDGELVTVLTRDVQRHILRGDIMHVDFFAVDENMTLSADVFIQLIGESPAAESGQGILITGPNSLSIEALPRNLPNYIEVDISGLDEVGSSIHVRDLDLGENLIIHNDPEELIVRVVQPSAARAELLDSVDAEHEADSEGGVAEDDEDNDEGDDDE